MKVAILTDLSETHDGYSLVHCIRDQVIMLQRYGHEPVVFVQEGFNGDPESIGNPRIEACIPAHDRAAYVWPRDMSVCDKQASERLTGILTERLESFPVAFSHDWVFATRKLPMAMGLLGCKDQTRPCRFYHWAHSVPGANNTWWDITAYGENHQLVYPNAIDAPLLANLFKGDCLHVYSVTDVADIRTLFRVSDPIWKLLDQFPGIIDADFAQIYPIARDRLSEKGLRPLIFVFKNLKEQGASVCLLIADSWTEVCDPEDLAEYRSIAYRNGLTEHEFGFTSEHGFPRCVPQMTLNHLRFASNTFICPSRGESFGLSTAEAILCGAFPVHNKNCAATVGTFGGQGLYLPFGSAEKGNVNPPNEADYYKRLATLVRSAALQDTQCQAKNFIRQHYNLDTVYRNYYEPILREAL